MLGEAAFLHSLLFELKRSLSRPIKCLPIIRLKNCPDACMASAEQEQEGNQGHAGSVQIGVQRVHCSQSDPGETSSSRGGG